MSISNELPKELGSKLWRIENLYKIINKRGELVTFKMNPAQKLLFQLLHTYNIIPKARQLGITTFFVVYMFDDVLFNSNYNAVMIAQDHETMKKIFRKVKIAWKEFPRGIKDYVQWDVETDNKKEIGFNNNSMFSVTLSSRSDTVNHLHVSELGVICKEYPDKEEEILTGAFPSVVPGGKITLESTVEESKGLFKDIYDEGFDEPTNVTTEMDYRRFFFPWTMDSAYTMDPKYIYDELPEQALQYQKEQSLTDGQICWWYMTKKSKRYTDIQMKRQFPTTVQEAFDVAIDNFFNTDNIKDRLLKDVHPPTDTIHGWDFYEPYNNTHMYGIGADPAEGIGKDHSAAVLIDFSHRLDNYQIQPKVVGRFYDNKIDPLTFAHNLADVGNMYGMCIICPERNNHGHAVIGKLKEIYPNIYKEVIRDVTYEDKERDRYGFMTSSHSKPQLLSELRQAVDDRGLIIPDAAILEELKIYGDEDYKRIKNDKKVTNHMDLTMALAIAWEMRSFTTGSYTQEVESITEPMTNPHSMI